MIGESNWVPRAGGREFAVSTHSDRGCDLRYPSPAASLATSAASRVSTEKTIASLRPLTRRFASDLSRKGERCSRKRALFLCPRSLVSSSKKKAPPKRGFLHSCALTFWPAASLPVGQSVTYPFRPCHPCRHRRHEHARLLPSEPRRSSLRSSGAGRRRKLRSAAPDA
jgi:hypothetical protein